MHGKPKTHPLRVLALAVPVLVLAIILLILGNPTPDPLQVPDSKQGTVSPTPPPDRLDPSQATAWQLVAAKREADARAEASAGPALPEGFLDRHVSGKRVAFSLPDQSAFEGDIEMSDRDAKGLLYIHGRVTRPFPGSFFIQRQTAEGVAGPFVGNIRFDGKPEAWKIEPTADRKQSRFVLREIDQVICANYSQPPPEPEAIEADPEQAPQTHPYPVAIPPHQSIVPLQSLPGATAVIYLDFDGETGPFPGWGNFNAAPANANNSQIFEVWKMVCEDFQGFNINITTDRKVFDNAPAGRRQHIIITPTNNAAPGAGGVAYVGSFNWAESRPCWAFYSTGKSSCEVISHEIGHTLGLSHDGRVSPSEGYYGGHGSGSTGWAPIMGVGYYQNLSQWSKGEYLSANQTQDDLAIITNNNNDVDYRTDDYGDALSASGHLEIQPNNSVSNEGILEKTGDIDSFRFTTTGGTASLTVSTVSSNPNLDLLAEIVNAGTSAVVVSDNPDTGINATVTASLAAGEYLLRVRGTGRGDPLGNGYTDYGCIGSYLVSGSVTGGIKPDRFSIAENSPNGSSVGTVAARLSHGANPLTWAIASGNTSGAFAINASTGAITVANQAALNYEALSLRWDDPSAIELFVTITDAANPSLNETIRTVVTVTNVNEAPAATGATLTLLERTAVGTTVATINGTDPDRFDFPNYAITAGNTGGAFAINSGTGRMTVASHIEVAANTNYNLTVTVTDQGSPALSANVPVNITVVNIADGYTPGSIVRTYFENISGGTVSNLTGNAKFPNNPDSEEFLASFDGGGHGDNFGSTIRGYLIPPATGTYRFWIASDDASQLRFTTTTNPANASSIASVSGWTDAYAWTANSSQQSATFNLTAGQPCYIEARHKEGGGGDHVAVAWTGPGIATRQVIPGIYLAPFYQNYAPKVTVATFSIRENALAGQTVGTVTATDVNASDTFSAFTITAGNGSGIFGIDSATGRLFVANGAALNAATAPTHTLSVRATDSGSPALNGTGSITVNVLPAGTISLTGIHQEIWTGISGATLTSLTGNANYPYRPGTRRTLSSFDTGTGYGDSYGSRIRVRFIPPSSGDYQFYIAGDDDCRLLFSNDPSGTGAAQIANISGWSDANQWTKYASQTSTVRTLVAGQAVYLETLHKEGSGGDHISVGYTGPDVTATTVIPGSMLQPFDINAPPVFSPSSYSYSLSAATATSGQMVGTVSATEPNNESLVFAITSGNTAGAFAIHSSTGTITVANPASLSGGVTSLQIAAQDGGLGAVYPFKSATATVNITVTAPNSPPVFAANPISRPDATEDIAYSSTLSGLASDPNAGDTLTFSKTSGPSWLTVAANGALGGTPGNFDPGPNTFVVRVTDNSGAFAEATLNIHVTGVNFPPAFAQDPIHAGALVGTAFAANLSATDPDAADTPVFSKVSGPAWLAVEANGSLSGTPAAGDAGANTFVVRVTDNLGLADEATLNVLVLATPVWGDPGGGSWPLGTHWLGGVVANGAGTIADFSTLDLSADATITLDGGRVIGHLDFADAAPSHHWTLAPGSGGQLTLDVPSGTPTVTVRNQSATIGTALAGSKGFTKLGDGSLILAASNIFTGNLTISDGVLELAPGGKLYNAGYNNSAVLTISPGGTWRMPDFSYAGVGQLADYRQRRVIDGGTIEVTGTTHSSSQNFTVTSSGGTFRYTNPENTLHLTGNANSNLQVNGPFTLETIGKLTISEVIDGTGSLVKSGDGTLLLDQTSNTLTGDLTIAAGTLLTTTSQSGGTNGPLGAVSGARVITVEPGVTLRFQGNNVFGGSGKSAATIPSLAIHGTLESTRFNILGDLTLENATLTQSSSDSGSYEGYQFLGTVTVGGTAVSSILSGNGRANHLANGTTTFHVADATSGSAADLVVDSPLRDASGDYALGAGSLTKTGAGTMTLSAANTYTGATTISEGTLLVNGSLSDGAVTVGPAGTLAGAGDLGGSVTNSGTIAPGSAGTAKLGIGGLLALQPDCTLEWEVSDWSGASVSSWDTITVNGLDIASTPDNPTVIRIREKDLSGFVESNQTFTLIENNGPLSGFDAARFSIDASAFTAGAGTWSVESAGGQLLLVYTRPNSAPVFAANPFSISATEDLAFTASVGADDTDPSETLTYTKLSGPDWLLVAPNGDLSGTPANADVGLNTFTILVEDSFAAADTLTLGIAVENVNDAPVFAADPILESATEDSPFTGQLAASDIDAGDSLAFAKVSGPAWLDVASTGELSGTPANSDVGSNIFTVSASDGIAEITATLVITVENVNDAPVFTSPVITGAQASSGMPYDASLAGSASDPDPGDTLTFSKVAGPDWLTVAADGTLGGTPQPADAGANTFTVRATDSGGLHSEASLGIEVAQANPDANTNGMLDTWETEKFGNADPGANLPGDDPDGDGLSNLLEYALDTHPLQSNPSPLLYELETVGPDKHLRLTVPKNPLATNLQYVVEVSDSPTAPWLSDTATDTEILADTPAQLVVRDRTPASTATRRFIRLRVSTTAP